MRLVYRYLLSGNNLNQLALAFQPDINAFAENLRFDKRTVFALLYHLGGRQAVKNVLVAAAFKQEAQALQMAAVQDYQPKYTVNPNYKMPEKQENYTG